MIYDHAVIGAGINGCALSYFLTEAGKKTALIDKEGIAAGGSGAAGAFVSPKFSKGGPLKALMDSAFRFSLDFYNNSFAEFINNVPLLHIARFKDENDRVAHFKEHTDFEISDVPEEVSGMLTDYARSFESVYLLHDGIVDARGVCGALAQKADLFIEEIEGIVYRDGLWHIGDIISKEVTVATGAYSGVLVEPYIQLRPVWGQRIDIRTSTRLDFTIHHQLSISPSSEDGVMALGATHDLNYNPQLCSEPYDLEPGRKELIEKALDTIELKDIEVIGDYTGLRSGSNDYLPLLGRVVKAEISSVEEPEYYPALYMINGVGGYGFVQGPYLARQLSRHILYGEELDEKLAPERFFRRWIKRGRGMAK